MKIYNRKITLALAMVALAAPISAKHLPQLWDTETTKTPEKIDTTFEKVSSELHSDASETAQLNKEYQSNKYLRENIEKFEKAHKSDLSGKSNYKIAVARQDSHNHELYLNARLKEIQTARQRIRTALEKANSYVKNHAAERTEHLNDLQKSLNDDNDSFLEKKSNKIEKKNQKAEAEKKEKATNALNKNKKKKKPKKVAATPIQEPVEKGF